MRGFTVWALWAALGLLLLDVGLEARNGREVKPAPQQQQVLSGTGGVTAMDGGDKIPPPTPLP